MSKLWLGDLLDTIEDCAGANDDEAIPVVSALVNVVTGKLVDGISVGVVGLGSFTVEGTNITFSPSRHLLDRLRGRVRC